MKKNKKLTIKELEKLMRDYRKKGLKPYLKGKGNKSVKIEFE
jgi:hypothetical protein